MKAPATVALFLCLSLPAGLRAQATSRPASAPVTAKERYEKALDAYQNNRWAELGEHLGVLAKQMHLLTPQQSADITYVRQAAQDCRPAWWFACKQGKQHRFQAIVLERPFAAQYTPAEKMGFQFRIENNEISVSLAWNSEMMDKDSPASDAALAKHGSTDGDLTELMIWQLLGVSRVMTSFPPKTAIELYGAHEKTALEHYQEFRSRLAVLYHSSPRARRTAMVIYLSGMVYPDDGGPDSRSRQAVSHMFLAKVLSEPAKWPSIYLPPRVPKDELLKSLALHIKVRIKEPWTLAEDKALRELTLQFARVNDQEVFRSGKVSLPNGQAFALDKAADEPFAAKREQWIRTQLEKAAARPPAAPE